MHPRRADLSPHDRSRALLDLQLRLQNGDSPEDGVAFLISRGFSPHEARSKIDTLVSESVRADRRKGLVWLACSAVCFLVAAPLVWGVIGGVPVRGYVRALAHAGALPGLLVLGGLITGVRAIALLLRRSYSADPD